MKLAANFNLKHALPRFDSPSSGASFATQPAAYSGPNDVALNTRAMDWYRHDGDEKEMEAMSDEED